MRRIVLAALLFVPVAALAASPFDGTWKTNTASFKTTGKADTFQVLNGTYTCSSCVPAIEVKADGTDQKVTGHAYYDTIAVVVMSPSAIHVIHKQGGKPVLEVVYNLSADGKTLTGQFKDYTGTQVSSGTFSESRRAPGPAGSHPVSGAWQPETLSSANEANRTYVYQMTKEQFSMQWNGQSYNAKFDGKEYPVHGDPGKTTVILKKIDDHTVYEIDHRQGKVTDEIILAAAPDGQSLAVTDRDTIHDQITTYTLDKQQ